MLPSFFSATVTQRRYSKRPAMPTAKQNGTKWLLTVRKKSWTVGQKRRRQRRALTNTKAVPCYQICGATELTFPAHLFFTFALFHFSFSKFIIYLHLHFEPRANCKRCPFCTVSSRLSVIQCVQLSGQYQLCVCLNGVCERCNNCSLFDKG